MAPPETPRRQRSYPEFFEKAIPVALVALLIIIAALLIVILLVVLGLFPSSG